MDVQGLLTQSYIIQPFECNVTVAKEIIGGLEKINEEPPQDINQWWLQIDGMHRKDLGIKRKKGEQKANGQIDDHKLSVHYVPGLEDLLLTNGVSKTEIDKYEQFFVGCKKFLPPYVERFQELLEFLDHATEGKFKLRQRYQKRKKQLRHILRCLLYPPGMTYDAQIHFDRGFLTDHAYETHRALHLVLDEQCTNEIGYMSTIHQLLTFLGVKAELIAKEILIALAHYVQALHATENRGAIVVFHHLETDQNEQLVEEIGDSMTMKIQKTLHSRYA